MLVASSKWEKTGDDEREKDKRLRDRQNGPSHKNYSEEATIRMPQLTNQIKSIIK